MNSLTPEQNSTRPTSPGRFVVSRGTCLLGSTSRTCSRANPPYSYPSTPSPRLKAWWSWSNSAEEPSPKLCGRQASASGGTAAGGPRAAGSCQSSGCSVRRRPSSTAVECSSVLVGSVFLSTMCKFVYGLEINIIILTSPRLSGMKILLLAFAAMDHPPECRSWNSLLSGSEGTFAALLAILSALPCKNNFFFPLIFLQLGWRFSSACSFFQF